MAKLLLSQISLSFADREILRDIHLQLEPGRRISLAGANGSGKTTLLKIAAGLMQPDTGKVSVAPGTSIGYLPQTGIAHAGRSLWQEAERAFAPIHDLIAEREAIGEQLSNHTDESENTEALVEAFTHAQERIDASGYYERHARIARVLRGLGFTEADFDRPVETFSGGWQMRVALAKNLLEHPDILLLDEPTNYLDIEARDWLRAFLASFEGAVLIVAHDRDFLDHAVNETAELYMGTLTVYRCSYTEYERRRETELAELVKRYEEQQAEIGRLEDFIRRFRYNASKASMVQSRIKTLEKMERIEIPETMKRVHLTFPSPAHSGREMIRLRNLSKHYDERCVLQNIDLTVLRGEKVAITGHNGAGKTTLLRILGLHDNDYSGTFELGSGVRPGYFGQDVVEALEGEQSVLEAAEEGAPTELIPQMRSMLGAFLFRGDDVFKPVGVLSGGEKSRLAMLKLLLAPYNLLILDEPTNHLDMSSQDVLLDALRRYEGTVMVVSHDRDFLRGLAGRVIELSATPAGARMRDIPGDFAFYEWKVARELEETDEASSSSQTARPADDSASRPAQHSGHREESKSEPPRSSSKREAVTPRLDREQRKSRQRELRRTERESARLLERAEELEREIENTQEQLSRPENYSDGETARTLTQKLQALQTEHESTLAEWEKVTESADAIRDELEAAG